MRIIITEDQRKRLLTEEVSGLGEFLYILGERYPEIDKFHNQLKRDIEKSNCQKIEMCGFSHRALGASLPTGVLINKIILDYYSLPYVIFVIFHEIAHQYQYKKYGADFSYKIYSDEIPVKDGIRLLKQTENTADQFGIRKCREYGRMGLYREEYTPPKGNYEKFTDEEFTGYINGMKSQIKSSGLTSTEEITTMFYNWIKSID
jgi:hypothetical protein